MQEYKVSCAFIDNLQRFSAINPKFHTFLRNFNLSEQSKEDSDAICQKLADYLLNAEYTLQITECFRQDFLKILALAVPDSQFDLERHLRICVLLAKVLSLHPDAERFILNYFKERPSPFMDDLDSKPPVKRCKLENNIKISDLEIVQACLSFLKHNPEFFKRVWPWSQFILKYFNHEDEMVKWYYCQCIAILTGMNEIQLNDLLNQSLTKNESKKCCINNEFNNDQSSSLASNDSAFNDVHIPIYEIENIKSQDSLIEVQSTKENLRKISLGIAANKAVCLVGPVGSGKTTLVEYLARKVGRIIGESFVKIQLGDQTDSKMLLGTYRCTDIPGEFVWQPGVLTQAVIDGSWILLEDIDSANVDITSILSSILENGCLTVPGYRDTIPVSSGFQLFVTQRLTPTITGGHKKHTNATAILEKRILQVNLDPLTEGELQEIIQTLHPVLKTICIRMVKVFSLFSNNGAKLNGVFGIRASRLTSTRDLFKWCARAVVDFDVSSQGSALKVLQDAIDIFCCSYSNLEERVSLAGEISTHLGIINEKANYFCNQHKPSLILSAENFIVGRASLKRQDKFLEKNMKFCFTRPAACLLERIMCCVQLGEPVLLVGETGTGKTSSVQYLAHMIGQKLVVVNMNQQSDSADLLGGFKPIDTKFIVRPVKTEFENVFRSFFNVELNKQFLRNISYCYNERRYGDLLKMMRKSYEAAMKRLTSVLNQEQQSDKLEKHLKFLNLWTELGRKLQKLEMQLKQKNSLAFAFIEGSLVRAIENGHWVLLDEINLANAETLECLSGLLEGPQSSISLLERGDKKPIKRHENFTLFACMNPSTDVGKKDLPVGLRNRFTEFFVDELTEKNDLALLVNSYLDERSLSQDKLENIVKFYLTVRKEAVLSLSDGLGHKPHFSLRSLCRALTIASKNPCVSFTRSLYEAFCLSFVTQLDSNSCKRVEAMIVKYVVGNDKAFNSFLNQPMIPVPNLSNPQDYLQFEGYWIHKGSLESVVPEDYILTSSVRKNLRDLVRVVSIGRLPVLLQGDTSIGKTSLIMYLAKCSGNKCVRINNHEHTDLQEYIGSYIADANGKLVFREGVLVEAMRKGHWIILDELNLAPTDVLEALNRVLDDNRELFIPETQETVKADPKFMLFATQNPPGAYGGRKMLSRAFRNRFIELHFNEIPSNELEFILHKRCQMAPSYAEKMINIMRDLQTRRRSSAAFAGKHGFITLRDLFRWGERYRLAENKSSLYDWDQHLADEGFLVLAGRVRKGEERKEIIQVIKKHMRREVDPQNLFTLSERTSTVTRKILEDIHSKKDQNKGIFWTYNMQQHAVLVSKAMQFHEPVLLVGETGSGKTTICKLLAENNGLELITVNCHMHTESSDFIGGLRPVRTHTDEDLNKLFEWCDGPLIQAMVQGNVFLADEISLADDSVLERLNSLLEPERNLLLAEKGIDINNKDNSELVTAHQDFHFISTMNPGGDFGKKELSPALRNRLTEIWCDSCNDRQDLTNIIEHNVKPGILLGNQEDCSSGVGKHIMDFIVWFRSTEIGKRFTISVRDILTWTHFINSCFNKIEANEAFLHGACLTFLDSLGSGVTSMESASTLKKFRNDCISFLSHQIEALNLQFADLSLNNLSVHAEESLFKIGPFSIEMGSFKSEVIHFSFDAPTTLHNTLRLLRGLQLNKALLLEGSPGVGKTSIVTALAKATKNVVFRINLSDQTDISDLFGADLPVEGGSPGQFAWRDGPLLQALKRGYWILLDELNLAPQSVLEGLNACLDHRGEIFIPELGKTFLIKPGTRFFACQNPTKQGGSRRGLPKSFLNRFTQVYMSPLNENDLLHILRTQFPDLPDAVLERMVDFNTRIVGDLEKQTFGYKGGPWEFNLRDLTRWCEATIYHYKNSADESKNYAPECLVELIYSNRMRSLHDRECIAQIFESVFGKTIRGNAVTAYVTHSDIHLGDISLERESNNFNVSVAKQETSLVLRSQLGVLRSLAYCVNLGWMSILVGNAGCGKTSVVRTVAQLCGKILQTVPVNSAMDTTDLLGGFEQTDYTRHLEEISKQTEQLVYLTVQKMLVRKEKSRAAELLRSWENSVQLLSRVTQNQTLLEETQLFIEKLDALNKVWNALLECDLTADQKHTVEYLQNKSKSIKSSVKDEGCLNAGGKFEWVDSILVKCLVNGSWLLIDNVNLCSPAVLDRLNALLEPNGTLTIGERGIDENGKMIEIRPHKDFRLFLTMDPKNGEISRAMRNRGIEIYIFNENESPMSKNMLDIKSLMTQNGLSDQHIIEVLLQIHNFISNLMPGEKPNVNHIIQSSFLIAQQLKRGINTRKALHSTIIDVYYKTKSSYEFSTNDAQTLILAELDGLLNSVQLDLYSYDATLKTLNLQCSSEMSKVKQQIVVLDKHLRSDSTNLRMTQYFLMHFYSIASSEDVELRRVFIEKYMETNNFGLKNVALALHKEVAGRIGTRSLPADQRWVIDLPCKQTGCNKLLMSLYFISCKLLNEISNSTETLKGKKDFTLLEYINSVKSKKIEGKIDDVVVKGLYDMLVRYDEYVGRLLRNLNTQLNDAAAIEVFSLFQWRFLLYQILKQDVITNVTQTRFEEILTNLHVHYKWFFKHSITKLNAMFPACNDNKLIEMVNEVNSNLSNQFSLFKKIARRYQKINNSPPPLVNVEQVNVLSEYNAMASAFNLYTKEKRDLNKILNNILAGDLLPLLIDVKAELCCKGVPENFPQLKQAFDEFNKSSPETNPCKTTFKILPIIDYFALLTMHKTRSDFSNDLITISSPTIPPSLQGILKCSKLTSDKRLQHEITSRMSQYMMTCASLAPSIFLNYGSDEEHLNANELHLHLPVLSYLITNVLVSCEKNKGVASTEFGNYRNAAVQCRQINLLLWKNMQSISGSDYDYLSLEMKYLQLSFHNFTSDFATSLGIQNDCGVIAINDLVEAIDGIYSTSGTPEHVDKEALISLLRNCSQNISSLDDDNSLTKTINHLANAYVYLNYLKAWLNSKLAVIDPLTKMTLKKKYCLEEKANLECLKLSYEIQNEVYSGVKETLPTLCDSLDQRVILLQQKSCELGQYVAVRPESLTYDSVLKKINHGFSTILSRIKILELNNNVDNCVNFLEESISQNKEINEANLEKCHSSLRLTSSTAHSLNSFIDILSKARFLYPDIIEPLLSNVTDLLYGIKLKGSLLHKMILQYTNAKQGITLHKDLIDFIKFPALNENQQSCIETVDLYVKDNFQNFVRECIEPNSAAKQENLNLLKCGIQEMYNACVIDAKYTRILTKELFLQFDKLIAIFINAWNKQETERETKIKEAESLYKVRTKCEELSEEQTIEKEFKALFPNHHETDFPDLQAPTLEDDSDEGAQNLERDFTGLIIPEDVKFVSNLHKQFMCTYTTSEWLNPQSKSLACDYIKPLIQKFRLFKTLLNQMVHCLNYDLDAEALGSLSVLSRVAQKFGDTKLLDEATSPSKSGSKKEYNFYVDSNIEEVTGSYHVLQELQTRISELLNEWPDHPTLQNINLIIQRIYAFDVTSPLSRFMTGFEILLTKCNEWEQNAHVGVSLQQFSLNVTHQIISWRKLELSMWKDSLNNSFERLNEPISKWWLYLYNIFKQFTEENLFTTDELIETLQKFITQSNLAEFENRLELIFVFHCHCTHLQKTTETELLTNVLWNVHNYYAQFIPVVNAKIKELRSPVERKLKDYVKIVRWKDISYWAVKETLERTHKTIHKHMKEFEGLLSHSILPYLKNTTLNTDFENVGIWDRPQRSLTKTYHYAMDPATYMAKQSLVKKLISSEDDEAFLTKVRKYFNKSRLLCKNTVSSVQYPSLIQILDGFVADIIETGSLLDKTEIDTTLPKEKQKSQAKNLLHQKRTALATLFKSLITIGLSYRTGIIESKQRDAAVDFLLEPLDLKASLSYLSHRLNDKKLLTIWDGCEMYYTKSLMRLDVLQSALNTPSKDLGPNNIERLKGFSFHLMKLNHDQKAQLIISVKELYGLRFYATYFSEFCDEEMNFLQAGAFDRITAFLKNVVIVVEQYKLVLDSSPEGDLTEQTVPILQPESPNPIQYKHDDQWRSAMSNINSALSNSEKILTLLVKSKTFIPRNDSSVRICLKYLPVPDLQLISSLLDAISTNLSGLLLVFGDIPLSGNLKWLLSNLGEIKTELNEETCEISTTSKNDLPDQVEQLINRMLLSIQNVYKKYKEIQPETEDVQATEEQNDASLSEQHLKTLIVENLLEDLKQFNMHHVLNFLTDLARQAAEINPSSQEEFRNSLAYALPILEQLILLYEYFITQQVLAYRISSKMSAVLLNIFIELATKGFCIPPELSDEVDSEGQQSKQSGGMGLGDGEGEKDVSDRIESEDQLEDAKPSSEDKNQDDQKDCKEEEKGIDFSEDFDSKLQDVEKQPGEESDEEESKSDAEEQMGETDKDAEQLDQQIWGSDEEEEEDEANNEDENNKSEEKGDKGKQEGEKELAAKDGASKSNEDEDEGKEENKEKRPQNKEINKMDDQEYDDQQIDPYHGNQPELPEPEPMDLPDDVQLDDAEKENEENQEDNPFDVDTMKEQFPPKEDAKDDEAMETEGGDKKEENDDLSHASDDDDDDETPENKNEPEKEDVLKSSTTEEEQNESENAKQSALDETETNGEGAQPMDVDDVAADNVQANQSNIQRPTNTNEDVMQDDGPDKEGVGQSQFEDSSTGHKSGAQAHQESQQGTEEEEQPKQEKRQRPGDSDAQRSLGDVDQPAKKKLKTIDPQSYEPEPEEAENEIAEKQVDAEMYQHIKDAKSVTEEQVLDAATKEQVEQQKDVSKSDEEQPEGSENLMKDEEEDVEITEVAQKKAEKLDVDKSKHSEKASHPEGDITDELNEMEIEGDVIKTTTVPRGGETTHHTQYNSSSDNALPKMSAEEITQLRNEVEQQLSTWNEPPTSFEAKQAWEKISSVTLPLAQDLAEQLRLVLEPTQTSRLKGDYRTGRRINMRKVIPYIASQFRKDKIWLRRTKPSKREYQIVMAIDDSASMADNHSKELAFESVALISKALSLLESGQLSVLSFGEQTEVLHKLTDTFTENSGSKLMQKFQFAQKKTCVARLVDFASEMLMSTPSQTNLLNAKLLIIVSDGRGIFSEGENYVHQAVRRAKLSNIFMIFVIVDNPKNESSILDIRMPIFSSGKLLTIKPYMDSFPFPFYIILRDINSLPTVLSDALKQWFEMVSSSI